MNVLQSPVEGVKHRSEYPGGQSAYLNSGGQYLYVVEIPIDEAFKIRSGKFNTMKGTATLDFQHADWYGSPVPDITEFPFCDDREGGAYFVKLTGQERTVTISKDPCQTNHVLDTKQYPFFSKPVFIEETLLFTSERVSHSGSGPGAPCSYLETGSADHMDQCFSEAGFVNLEIKVTIEPTGYAANPFMQDFYMGINMPKPVTTAGSHAAVTFIINNFQTTLNYRKTYTTGYGDGDCSFSQTDETFDSFTAQLIE